MAVIKARHQQRYEESELGFELIEIIATGQFNQLQGRYKQCQNNLTKFLASMYSKIYLG